AALQRDPRSAEGFAALGYLLAVGLGDFEAALRRFRIALQLQPDAAATHYLLGRACFARAQFALAAAMFERAASLRADNFHALVMAGKARLKIGDAHQSRADFVQALARIEMELSAYPDGYRAICGKSHCLWHLGREEEALQLLDSMTMHRDPM